MHYYYFKMSKYLSKRLSAYPGAWRFRLLVIACLTLSGFSCDKNPIGIEEYDENPIGTEKDTYWATPEWAGVYLSFSYSEDIEVDSVLAGNIQYRLNVARSVDEQLAGWGPFPWWFSRELILTGVSAYFDTATLRFNDQLLDSLLDRYPIWRVDRFSPTGNMMVLYFISDCNMPKLAESFAQHECVTSASPNGLCVIWPPPELELAIEGDTYKFIFTGGWDSPGNWEIHVVDDQATVISRP